MICVDVSFPILNEMLDYAKSSPKLEICGALLGKRTGSFEEPEELKILDFVPMANVSEHGKSVHYIPDPNELLNVLKRTTHYDNKATLDLVGIFHNHPNNAPRPSITDINGAGYAGVYIIYSNKTGELSAQYYDGGEQMGFKQAYVMVTGIQTYVSRETTVEPNNGELVING